MLTMPSYIRRSGIVGAPIQHSWNDADPGSYYAEDERLGYRIAKTCYRGVVALSAGFAEWIAWRFSPFVSDTVLLLEIEGVWAGVIDWGHLIPPGPSEHAPAKDWTGPVHGPIRSAFMLLSQIVALAKRSTYPADASSSLSKLALHVMPDPTPFRDWRRFAVERLSTLYPFDKDDVLGPPMPRQVLDPDFNYRPERAPELLTKYLTSLDDRSNPFLRLP